MTDQVWAIDCPVCGHVLQIPDERLFGRHGRCPKCQHKFLLEGPPKHKINEFARSDPNSTIAESEFFSIESDLLDSDAKRDSSTDSGEEIGASVGSEHWTDDTAPVPPSVPRDRQEKPPADPVAGADQPPACDEQTTVYGRVKQWFAGLLGR